MNNESQTKQSDKNIEKPSKLKKFARNGAIVAAYGGALAVIAGSTYVSIRTLTMNYEIAKLQLAELQNTAVSQ